MTTIMNKKINLQIEKIQGYIHTLNEDDNKQVMKEKMAIQLIDLVK